MNNRQAPPDLERFFARQRREIMAQIASDLQGAAGGELVSRRRRRAAWRPLALAAALIVGTLLIGWFLASRTELEPAVAGAWLTAGLQEELDDTDPLSAFDRWEELPELEPAPDATHENPLLPPEDDTSLLS